MKFEQQQSLSQKDWQYIERWPIYRRGLYHDVMNNVHIMLGIDGETLDLLPAQLMTYEEWAENKAKTWQAGGKIDDVDGVTRALCHGPDRDVVDAFNALIHEFNTQRDEWVRTGNIAAIQGLGRRLHKVILGDER